MVTFFHFELAKAAFRYDLRVSLHLMANIADKDLEMDTLRRGLRN